MRCVQFGCGHSAPEGWINFDASPTLRLERFPIFGPLVRKNGARFPANVKYGDIIKGLPLKAQSVDFLYASHVIEHLSRDDALRALSNSFSYLAAGGVFRVVVPDLESRARRYIADQSDGSADRFMLDTGLGFQESRTIRSAAGFMMGNSTHRWMWDFRSLGAEFQAVGFSNVRRCVFGDGHPAFSAVEKEDRFVDPPYTELAIEGVRQRLRTS